MKTKLIAILIMVFLCAAANAMAAEESAPAAPAQPATETIAAPVVAEESVPTAPAQPAATQGAVDTKPAAPAGASATSSMIAGPRYQIGPGDVLEISAWRDEALSRQVTVLPDGTISFPLIGELQAEGKTIAELKQEMVEKLKLYVTDPILSVEVKSVNSMLIYVIGRSNTSSRFGLNANVTVLQALAMAGGLNPFAKRGSIKVMRQEGDKVKIFPFHYDDVIEGKRLEENITLKRGDVIVVP